MATIYQVLIDWTIPSGRPARSVLHFNNMLPPPTLASNLNTVLSNWTAQLANGVIAKLEPGWKQIQDTDGSLFDQGDFGATAPHAGGVGSQPVADATQVNLRLKTGVVRGNRLLQGHIYLPGLPVNALSGGNLLTATGTLLASGLSGVPDAFNNMVVWSRPAPGKPGTSAPISSVAAASELSVLRRRRNR